MQQYFGIDYDDYLCGRITTKQIASCAAYLPVEGAVSQEYNGGAQRWGYDRFILADMANSLRWLKWAKTKDAEKNRNKPEMIEPPKPETDKAEARSIDEIKEFLGRRRI